MEGRAEPTATVVGGQNLAHECSQAVVVVHIGARRYFLAAPRVEDGRRADLASEAEAGDHRAEIAVVAEVVRVQHRGRTPSPLRASIARSSMPWRWTRTRPTSRLHAPVGSAEFSRQGARWSSIPDSPANRDHSSGAPFCRR